MIKKFLDFIYEDNNELIQFKEIDDLHYQDDEILLEFFYDMIDEGWEFQFERGIIYDVKRWNSIYKVYSLIYIPGDIHISYELYVNYKYTNNDNLIDILISSIYRIADFLECDFYLKKDNEKERIDIKEIHSLIKDGGKLNNYFYIILYEKKITKISHIQVANYYGWQYDYSDKEGNIYIEFEFEDLVEQFANESLYKSYLLGEQDMSDRYYGDRHDSSHITSIFSYHLNDTNINNLIKKIINNNDGYKKIIEDNEYLLPKELETEENLINLYKKYPKELEDLEEVELLDYVMELYNDYMNSAQEVADYKSIEDDFFYNLNKVVNYTKIINDNTIYRIKFDYKWYEDYSYDYLPKFDNIKDILYEYRYIDGFNLNPSFGNYGDFDDNGFNLDIENLLK